jgi:hypothetical protein
MAKPNSDDGIGLGLHLASQKLQQEIWSIGEVPRRLLFCGPKKSIRRRFSALL